jgi:hypothetical protein
VTRISTPPLDERDAEAIAADILERVPGYVPDWRPRPGQPGWALVQIVARYLQVLVERLNLAPDRHKLAFLDMLGISLLPAQAARAPVVFTALPRMGDSRVPAGTRVGAKGPDPNEPIIFETETDIALASAQLAEVKTLWPGQDAYADHGTEALGGQSFTLFTPLQPIPHELYLAHDVHFALAGQATVEIQFDLSAPGSEPLALTWEYWDGQVWRGFKAFKSTAEAAVNDSLDGTEGLTRSGIVRLVADRAEAVKTKVNGLESFWVRARVARPIPRQPGRVWPQVDRVRASTIVANPHRFRLSSQESLAQQGTVEVNGPVFNSRGTVELRGPNIHDVRPAKESNVWKELTAGRYRLHVVQPGFAPFDYSFALSAAAGLRVILHRDVTGAGGAATDSAYADGQKLDLSKGFFPFGQQGQAGNSFYMASAEAFAKPGARITLAAQKAATPQGDPGNPPNLKLSAETWDGVRWTDVGASDTDLVNLFLGISESLEFDLPRRLASTNVNGEEGRWLRIRITSGGFARARTIHIPNSDPVTVIEQLPKALDRLGIGYEYHSPQDPPQACLTYNDFRWQDHTADARRQGSPFEPFAPVEDRAPALYLGFDAELPADRIGLYFDVKEITGETAGPQLRWEYWDGTAWLPLNVQDETRHLALPGMVSVSWPGVATPPRAAVIQARGNEVRLSDPRDGPRFQPGDQLYIERDGDGELVRVTGSARTVLMLATPLGKEYANAEIGHARLPRFGTPRTWLRARLQEDGPPRPTQLQGIYPNAVWVSQVETIQNEVLGSATAQPDQVQFIRRTPVLAGQAIEVRELDGARAVIELPLLIQDLKKQGMTEADVRTVADRRSGQISQVWVRWQERPHLFFSDSGDRHYLIERSRGRVRFGARIPPPGNDNIVARSYRSGGGLAGNVGSGAINQLLTGVLVKGITNPRAAQGGADGERPEAVLERGPLAVRNRRQALSADDYEALAREASPAVAVARALPATHPSGRPAPGWVKVVIMPHSQEPRPQPSFELRRQVRDFLLARIPASLAGQVSVAGPDYLAVGVVAVVAPKGIAASGPVLSDVRTALQGFLHPLNGGPDGKGWPFGRAVYLSDVAALLQSIAGVDYVRTLELTLDGTPRGEIVAVPEDRIVVAGPLQVTLTGRED